MNDIIVHIAEYSVLIGLLGMCTWLAVLGIVTSDSCKDWRDKQERGNE